VLASSWNDDGDLRWAQHEIVTALAGLADVHLFASGDSSGEGSITFHSVGAQIDGKSLLRRDLLIATFSAPGGTHGFGNLTGEVIDASEPLDALLPDSTAAWRAAGEQMQRLAPDLIVVLDHRDVGVLAACEVLPHVPVVLVPLVDEVATADVAHYDALFARAEKIIVCSHAERRAVQSRSKAPIDLLEFAVPAPAEQVQPGDVPLPSDVLVLSGADERDRFGRRPVADLVATAFPDRRVVIVSPLGTVMWHAGRRQQSAPPASESALAALLSGTSVVVDLRPGRFVAHHCIQALRAGTPIVVPARSRAREFCQNAQGGLWFSNAGGLLWSIEALGNQELAHELGRQGRRYCDEHHGSAERFMLQLAQTCGLDRFSVATPLTTAS
jgi:hypothetical protein